MKYRVEFKCLKCDRAWSRECNEGYDILRGVMLVQHHHEWECDGATFSNAVAIELGAVQSFEVDVEFKR